MKIEFDSIEELIEFAKLIDANASLASKRPMTDAERAKKCRDKKKIRNENVTNRDEMSRICDEIVTNRDGGESEKEEMKEEKDSPLSSPFSLSSSPLIPPNNNPITPYNPPLRKEESKEERELVPDGTKKPKLYPTDEAFWYFAKEEKDRAQAFYQATGIYPVKNEFGRWIKDLRAFTEANVSIDAMLMAIEKQRSEGITVSAPGSVFKTARSIAYTPPSIVAKQAQKEESWTERAERLERESENQDTYSFFNSYQMLTDGDVIDL